MSEDFESIKLDLERNPDIQPQLKDMITNVFYALYSFLDERQFKKWLLDNKFSSVARRTIIKSLSERKDKFFEENRWTAGYYTKNIGKKENNEGKIVLRKKVGDNAYVLGHETFHSLVDGLGGFGTFLGEGITEYLNKTMFSTRRFTYPENVKVVDLLSTMYGDRIFKYYFTKQGYKFFFDISKETSPDIQELMSDNNVAIERHLEKFHGMINTLNPANMKDARKELDAGITKIVNNFYMYKKDQISKLKYIKDGKVDFDSFIKEMAGVYTSLRGIANYEELQHFEDLNKYLISELIDNSHLLVGYEGKQKEDIKSSIEKEVMRATKVARITYRPDRKDDEHYIDQESELFQTLNQNAREKLLHKFILDNPDDMDFREKLDVINNIAQATNMSEEEIADAVKEVNSDKLPCGEKELAEIAQRYSVATSGLQALQIQSEQQFDSNRYVHLDLGCCPSEKAFFEYTDTKQYSIILLDPETGEINKLRLSEFGELLPDKGIVVRKCNKKEIEKENRVPAEVKDSDSVFEIVSIKDMKSTFIGIPDDLVIGKINDGESIKIANGSVGTTIRFLSDVKDDCLSRIVLDSIHVNIEEGQYSSNKAPLHDGKREDFDPRYVYYDNFVEDYNAITSVFEGVDESKEELRNMAGFLLDRTYEVDSIGGVSAKAEIDETYKKQRNIFTEKIPEFAEVKRDEGESESVRKLRGEINGIVFTINQAVRDLGPKGMEEEEKGKLLGSAIRATESRTRTGQIQEQIVHMKALVKERNQTQQRPEGR